MVKSNVRFPFGDKIRAVRERKQLTLKVVAQRAGVSESLISQIERNKVSPSIDTLLTLADVLDIDLEYLFQNYKKNKQVGLVRAAERDSRIMGKVRYQQLTTLLDDMGEDAIEALLLEIPVGEEKGDLEYGHTGKELGFILEGEGELVYGTERYALGTGDSISFSSDIPHILKNTGNTVMRAVWVTTPPRMFV